MAYQPSEKLIDDIGSHVYQSVARKKKCVSQAGGSLVDVRNCIQLANSYDLTSTILFHKMMQLTRLDVSCVHNCAVAFFNIQLRPEFIVSLQVLQLKIF